MPYTHRQSMGAQNDFRFPEKNRQVKYIKKFQTLRSFVMVIKDLHGSIMKVPYGIEDDVLENVVEGRKLITPKIIPKDPSSGGRLAGSMG